MEIQKLLKRTTLKTNIDKYLSILQQEYPYIGIIKQYTPIFEGYEDVNIVINTDNGKYVLKIFAEFRSKKNIHDYIKVIHKASEIGVQTLELVQSRDKKDFLLYDNTYSILTKYFEGENFVNTPPTMDEMIDVTKNIAKLNTLDFDVEESYDSWGNNNLLYEYTNTIVKYENVKQELLPIIKYLKNFNPHQFSKGVIHADMQRKHVLKNADGICIIDYGCMRNDLKVYDISTFLAWFCLGEDNWDIREDIIQKVLKEYTDICPLSENEIESIRPLITTSYAAYYLKTQELIEQGDNSKETLDWHNSAKSLYLNSINWNN